MEWRPKDWEEYYRKWQKQRKKDGISTAFSPHRHFEAGADAIMLALWNMAKAQPDGILRLNSNEVGEGLRFEV